jgi:cytochrome c biogenesis protein CcmG/thiol:disulfide interchange protein DsbE
VPLPRLPAAVNRSRRGFSDVLTTAALLATGLGRDPAAVASPLVGKTAPAFRLGGLDGPPVGLSELRGQVVVVNFWASWCTECHTEQDALNSTWSRFRDSGVTVLGVDFQDTTPDARAYMGSLGISYPVVEDKDSSTALAYGLRGVPETFVIDQTGRIADRVIGPVNADQLAGQINGLLQKRTP